MQEGRDMGIYVYVNLVHFVIKQKLTYHCKAIILNKDVLKKYKNLRRDITTDATEFKNIIQKYQEQLYDNK